MTIIQQLSNPSYIFCLMMVLYPMREEPPRTNWIESWVGPRTGLEDI
jgi:hypothetical protein